MFEHKSIWHFCFKPNAGENEKISIVTLQDIEIAIINYATSQLQNRLWLHGACLNRGDNLAFLIAPTGTGKTTLGLGLLSRGYKLLTDDIITICKLSGEVIPYPRCPKFRPAAPDQLSSIGVNIEEIATLLDPFIVLPSGLIQLFPQNILKKNTSVFLLHRGAAQSSSEVTPVTPSVALIEILRHSNLLYQDFDFSVFQKLFANTAFYRLPIASLGDNICQIERIADQ